MLKKIVLFCVIASFTFGAGMLVAQQSQARIEGKVVDAAGSPVGSVTVVAKDTASGTEKEATTDKNGEFRIEGLTPGKYLVQRRTTQNTLVGPGVTMDVQGISTLTIRANSSGEAETSAVQITADVPDASHSTTAIQEEFNMAQIELQPQSNAISRNGDFYGAYNLSLLSAGVTPGSILQSGVGPSVGGRPNSSNNFQINGIDNNNPARPGPLVMISNEAVSSFNLAQGQPVSDPGHSSGGQLNAILKQGTSSWHGGIYDYLNTRKLNAVEPALAGGLQTQRFDLNRMGVAAGGPLVPNSLFGFVDFEYTPLRSQRVGTFPAFVPTNAGYAAASSVSGFSAANLATLRNTVGAAPVQTTTVVVNGVGIPFGPLSTDVRTSTTQFNGLVNIDWHMGSTSQISARYGHNDSGTNAFGSTLPAFAVPGHVRALYGELSFTRTFSPTSVVNLNGGYNRLDQAVGGGDFTFPGLAAFPNLAIQDMGLTLGSNIDASRVRANTYQANGWADWVVSSRHHLRFGMDYRQFLSEFSNLSSAPGSLTYSSFQRFLLDQAPDAGALRTFGGTTFGGDRHLFATYFQDRIRLNSAFQLELGLGYQFAQLPESLRHQRELSGLSVPGLINFDEPRTDSNNFAPRIGVAWAPGAEHTVFRGGFGVLYDALNAGGSMLAAGMPANSVTNTASTTRGFLAGGGLNAPPTAASGVSAFTVQQTLPYIVQWNGSVSHDFARKFVADLTYMGNHGVHQPLQTVLNDPTGVSADFNLPVYFTNPGATTLNSLGLTQQILVSRTNAFTAAGFTNPIVVMRPDGTSKYNAVSLKMTEHFSGGSNLMAQYTYSDLRTDSTGTSLDFGNGRRMEQAPWNRKHRATVTPTIDIASIFHTQNGLLHNAAANLSIVATLTYERGARVPLAGGQGIGIFGVPVGTGVFLNPNSTSGTSTGVSPLTNSTGQIVAFLANDPSAQFVAGAPGTFSFDRPTARLADTRNIDMAIVKRFNFQQSARIELRGDAYNLLNHAQFTGMPISTLGTGLYGSPGFFQVSNPEFNNMRGTLSANPRTVQLALRVMF